MDKRTKLAITGIGISIGIALIFGNPVAIPEYRDRKPVDIKKAKADMDAYITRFRQDEAARAQAKGAQAESVSSTTALMTSEAEELAKTLSDERDADRLRAEIGRKANADSLMARAAANQDQAQKTIADAMAESQKTSEPAVQEASSVAVQPVEQAEAVGQQALTREQEIDQATADPGATVAVAQPNFEPPQKTEVMQIERRETTSQFLYMRVREHTLRFHVASAVDASKLEKIVGVLKNACLVTSETDMSCAKSTQARVIVDKLFFAEMKMSEVSEFSQSSTANGSLWKLASGSSNRVFRITQDSMVSRGDILARGFESQIINANMKRKPASQSSSIIEKVYVTRSRFSETAVQKAGTIR